MLPGCHMVPRTTAATDPDEVVVVAAFRASDLYRLHGLLCAYESPYGTRSEAQERRVDVARNEALRRYVQSLLDDLPVR